VGDRLKRLRRRFAEEPAAAAGEGTPPSERAATLERLRRQIASLDRKWARTVPEGPALPAAVQEAVQEALPGRIVETPRGPLRVIEETVPRQACHGRFAVGAFAEAPGGLAPLRLLYRLRAPPDPERVVFVDTETTGLAGGAGTLPFLVGLAWLDGGDLRLEQLFVDHPRHEAAMVGYLAERLARFAHAVTYNGRAFDVPLLQNRFVLHRTPFPPLDTSLDLLPAARRLHRRHLDDRSLGSIERHVLGFAREDDVPGAEIPGIYRWYLLTGMTHRLADVVRHNRWDVVALAALLGLHARWAAGPAPDPDVHPAVDVALGEICYEAGDPDRAALHLERAVARAAAACRAGAADPVFVDGLTALARVHRRCGRRERSVACWRRILAVDSGHGPAHLGLAKHHEHRTRDFEAAERHAVAAEKAGVEGAEQALRRLARIRGKRDQSQQSPGGP
jgi:uncharacterized protein YprB with RNaseH-like and TPR domain